VNKLGAVLPPKPIFDSLEMIVMRMSLFFRTWRAAVTPAMPFPMMTSC
jgi:hypothetical protein